MTSNFGWNDASGEEDTPLVKQLRKLIEDRDKVLNEQKKALDELSGKVRQQSVADVLREIGAKPGLAKFVPSSIETSADAVKAWLKENEDLFGAPSAPAATPDETSQPGSELGAQSLPLQHAPTPTYTPEQVAAFQRMGNADNNTTNLPDLEQSQIAQLEAFAKASGGNYDIYLEYLHGDRKLT